MKYLKNLFKANQKCVDCEKRKQENDSKCSDCRQKRNKELADEYYCGLL